MSWTQDYQVEDITSLLEKLIGRSTQDVLKDELNRVARLSIVSIKPFVLSEDMYAGNVTGLKVKLSDGTTYVHKLVKRVTQNGNYGCDVYELRKSSEKVRVVDANLDEFQTRKKKS